MKIPTFARIIRRALYLLRGNSPAVALQFALCELRGQKQLMLLNIGGVCLVVRTCTTDLGIARSCLKKGEFNALARVLKTPRFDFIIDAGGYIGTAAIALARMFPSATIVSIEPSTQNFALLCQNVEAFPNIIPLNMALLGTTRQAELRDRGTGEMCYTVFSATLNAPGTKLLHSAMGTTVDELMVLHSKSGVDILKLDIEGSEKEVLHHSRSWIGQVGILVAELHDRINPGCSDVFNAATEKMERLPSKGEKVIAINKSLLL